MPTWETSDRAELANDSEVGTWSSPAAADTKYIFKARRFRATPKLAVGIFFYEPQKLTVSFVSGSLSIRAGGTRQKN